MNYNLIIRASGLKAMLGYTVNADVTMKVIAMPQYRSTPAFSPRRWCRGMICIGLLPVALAQAQTAAPVPPSSSFPQAAPAEKDSILELSPFTVTAESSDAYMATQTLNGTRLKSSLRDLGVSITIFTDQLMDDLAATSVADLAAFAPNTDAYVGSVLASTGDGNEFNSNALPRYVTRGGVTGLLSQDFFDAVFPPDRYNAENFTFTRGPNAILFGLGNPAGAFASSTKKANFWNRSSLEIRGDNNGGIRTTLDINLVAIPKRLAVRYAGLYDDIEGFRDPSGSTQRRHFLTATFTPFRKTSIRVGYETGKVHTLSIRPWPTYDGITPWIDAGSPLLATAKTGNVARPGIQNAYPAASMSIIVTPANMRAGTVIAPMSWQNQGRSANPSFPNYPNLGTGYVSLVRPDLFPTDANVPGKGSFNDLDYRSILATWEQQLAKNLFLEASIRDAKGDRLQDNEFNGAFDRVYVDVNQQLPNGAPNPNVGMYYVDSSGALLPAVSKSTTTRLMVSYEFDFGQLSCSRVSWLGKHRMVGMLQDNVLDARNAQNPLYNLTPIAGFNSVFSNIQNRITFRYYLDPTRGVVSTGFAGKAEYPLIFANASLPPKDSSGVTPGYVAGVGGTTSYTDLSTRMIATQSSFWHDRIVATIGWRQDEQELYLARATEFNPYRDSLNVYPDARLFNAKKSFPDSRKDTDGYTYTRGVVFHAMPWLSFTYNESNNLQPNATRLDVAGNLLPDTKGEGYDYGIKVAFLQGRVVADLVYYKNYGRNQPDTAVANGLHGNLQADNNQIWAAIATVENDTSYLNFPLQWQDANTGYSDGYEASLTANLTKQWRLTINGSRRSPGETLDRGEITKAFFAATIPLWESHPTWLEAPAAGMTVAQRVASIKTSLANFDALARLPADSLLTPVWTFNMVTAYNFPKESRLKGFTVGATANVRGRTIVGFAENAQNVINPDKPYYAPEFATTGAWISYQRKLFKGKVDWRLQLNVRNLLDENRLFPSREVDRRDGTGAGAVVIYRLNEPRTFLLTSKFSF